MDISIILSIISIVIGLLPFYIKVENEPMRISSPVLSSIVIIIGIALFFSSIIGFPIDLRNSRQSDSQLNQNDVDITGDNNSVIIFNDSNNKPESSTSSITETPSADVSKNNNTLKNHFESVDRSTVDNIKSTLSPDEIVRQNYNDILEKKAEYTDADIKIINNTYIDLDVCEKVGEIFSDLERKSEAWTLAGQPISSAIVIFLDYETNNIIYTLTTNEKGNINYYPGNHKKFYYVVYNPGYKLYVSKPTQIEWQGSLRESVKANLEKEDSTFSPLFQICIKVMDSSQTKSKFTIFSNSWISIHFVERNATHDSFDGITYSYQTNYSGLVSSYDKCYFSINTNYVLDISLEMKDTLSDKLLSFYESPYTTIDSLITNTNLKEVFFTYDGSKVTPW